MSNVALVVSLISAYVIVIGFLGFVFISPHFRGVLMGFLRNQLSFVAKLGRSGGTLFAGFGKAARANGQQHAHHFGSALYRNRWLLTACALLVFTPILLAIFLRPHVELDGFDDTVSGESNRIVAELLQGEQLVPPPALPPEAFQTREVELIRPMLKYASRDWERLDLDFQQRLLLVFKLMEERHGYKMVLLEGYRSPERQNQLAQMGGHVTNARAFQSWHQYGLAADCAFLRNGKVVITERDPWAMQGYQLYGEIAEELGMVWGGRWKMMDLGHIELRKPGVKRKAPQTANDN